MKQQPRGWGTEVSVWLLSVALAGIWPRSHQPPGLLQCSRGQLMSVNSPQNHPSSPLGCHWDLTWRPSSCRKLRCSLLLSESGDTCTFLAPPPPRVRASGLPESEILLWHIPAQALHVCYTLQMAHLKKGDGHSTHTTGCWWTHVKRWEPCPALRKCSEKWALTGLWCRSCVLRACLHLEWCTSKLELSCLLYKNWSFWCTHWV